MAGSLTDLAGLKVGAEEFLDAVLEAAAQPICVVDSDDVIRFANPSALDALGYESLDDLLGRHSDELIHHKHRDELGDLEWLVRRDGSIFPVSCASVPIEMPGGQGAVVAFTDIGDRLRAEQQASLRRVATLVAGGAESAEVFAAIAREVGQVLAVPMVEMSRYDPDGMVTVIGAWSGRPHPFQAGTRWPVDAPTITTQVKQTGRPARVDDFTDIPGAVGDGIRESGIWACAGAPIVIDGDVWGVMIACSMDRQPLPDTAEARLAEFTELVATAISRTASRAELARLADEQAALRRVATLVARGVPPRDVFAAVAREVGLLLGVDSAYMARYDADGSAVGVASWGTGSVIPAGTRAPVEGESVTARVFRTGRPSRVDDYEGLPGRAAAVGRELGLRASVAAPIVVDQQLWGVMIASTTKGEALQADTESRILAFTELVATAISNTEARTEATRLTEEQAALRRVATLVAQDVPRSELFDAVAEEVGRLLGTDLAGMIRYEADDIVTALATWAAVGEHAEVGGRWPLDGGDLGATIARTSRPGRIDDYDGVPGRIAAFMREELGVRSSAGSPIVVEGRLWGALFVHSTHAQPLPPDTGSRLRNFTELVATAMSNAQARGDVTRLAEEQAALRRVATLVARESSPAEVFAAVTEEVGRLLHVEDTKMIRYEPDATATVVASWGALDNAIPVGDNQNLDGDNVSGVVYRTGRSARIDDYASAEGPLAESLRSLGVRSAVAAPIVVGRRLWGAMVAVSRTAERLPPTTESRIGEFTALVATAIANLDARSELAASRARVVAAADDERRRVVRDLHDGAQQRLVHTVVTLKLARRALALQAETAPAYVTEALDQAERATAELRELAHGILPGVLTAGGLRAGVDALASRMPVPVEIRVSVDRLPAPVEATAYFVVAEALTNIAKHARAASAEVVARVDAGTLRVQVRDDGVGGARPDGSGLLGLADRLATLDGRLEVESPADGGTLVTAAIPLSGAVGGARP